MSQAAWSTVSSSGPKRAEGRRRALAGGEGDAGIFRPLPDIRPEPTEQVESFPEGRQRREEVRRPRRAPHDHHCSDAVCPLVAPLHHLPTAMQVISNSLPVRDGMFKGTSNFTVDLTPNYMYNNI